MGSAIASRLVDTYELMGERPQPGRAAPLVERGARFVALEDIATCSVVFLSLPGPKNVLDLLLGDDGLVHRMQEGSLVIDTTSSTPLVDEDLAEQLAEHGVAYVTHRSRAACRVRTPETRRSWSAQVTATSNALGPTSPS